ncbi:MAG: GNAT family N-acetyltransferase [Oscillatoria sp. SIO1A7]|nr:GNAT family N-acetyltransferase [Oscillatoria sp. SIO1A7]
MNRGMYLLKHIKDTATYKKPQLGLRIPNFEQYFLRPIPTRPGLLNSSDVQCLTQWRNQNKKSFLTEFNATESRTSDWLTNTVHNDPGRILFMIEHSSENPIGYMGLANINWETLYGEADSVVRGKSSEKGLMSVALITLMKWAINQLEIIDLGVRVLSDNPATNFYENLGFLEKKRVPLRQQVCPEITTWIEDDSYPSPNRYLVHYVWREK